MQSDCWSSGGVGGVWVGGGVAIGVRRGDGGEVKLVAVEGRDIRVVWVGKDGKNLEFLGIHLKI